MNSASSISPVVTFVAKRPPHWGRWLALLAVLLVSALAIGVTFFLDPWLRRTLEKKVLEGSQGRYQLRVAELHTSLWQRTVRVHGVQLLTRAHHPDSSKLPTVLLKLGSLHVTGIGLLALLQRKEVPVDSIQLDSLTVHMAALPKGGSKQPLHERLPFNGVRIQQVALRHVRATYGSGLTPLVALGNSTATATDVWISAAGAADSSRIGYAANVSAQIKGAAIQVPGHSLKVVRATFSSASRRLRLDSLLVHPQQPISNSRSKTIRISLVLPQLELAGLQAASLARHRFRADTLRFTSPRLALTLPAQTPPSFHTLLAPYFTECNLKGLTVTDGQLRVAGLELAPVLTAVTATAEDIRVLPYQKPTTSMYYAKAWRVRTGRASATLDAPYYSLTWQQLQADTKAGQLQIRNVLVLPRMSVTELARSKGHQAAHISVRMPAVQVAGFNYAAAANRQELLAAAITLRAPQVSTQGDGRFTNNPHISHITPEELGKVPFRFGVKQFRVEGATITMSYRSPRDPQPGIMSINRFTSTLRNLSNDPQQMSGTTPLTGTAVGWLQDRCKATVALRANLLDATGYHTFSGTIGSAPISILHSMIVPTRGIQFRSGQIEQIRFQMQLTQSAAQGTMWGRYADLKLQLLNQAEQPKGLLPRVKTTLVNGIFIRDNNPRKPGQPLQTGSMASSRDRTYSVFSLWRQGIVSGMLNSAGVPAGLAKKLSEAK